MCRKTKGVFVPKVWSNFIWFNFSKKKKTLSFIYDEGSIYILGELIAFFSCTLEILCVIVLAIVVIYFLVKGS
jgi:hypothetical protein